MDMPPTAKEHWLARLARHNETLTAAMAARDRDLATAHAQRIGLNWRDLGGAAGINHETARTRALHSEHADPLPPLQPGSYLTVPIPAMPEPGKADPHGLLALALAALSFQLTGWLPPSDWSADTISGDLATVLGDRLPPGHYWGLAPEPDTAAGTWSYGIWPDDYGL
ncbi:hypothetical protein [Streptomyces noursei]|uniref:Uncharacterized protein n=1 Tax=Streptomyces noursei TaxID=1971 RepID=A0A2N8PR14_STRNR|nr:hypothetical protein [Streptomyces noursei]PNE43447.1 hypothetical protein AOB60_00500 [Streptomyces noursei]